MIPLGIRKVLGLKTSGFVEPLAGKQRVQQACILANLAVNFILSSMNLQLIWEVGRGWGDQQVIGCLTETTTCVVAKPLVYIYIDIDRQIDRYRQIARYRQIDRLIDRQIYQIDKDRQIQQIDKDRQLQIDRYTRQIKIYKFRKIERYRYRQIDINIQIKKDRYRQIKI